MVSTHNLVHTTAFLALFAVSAQAQVYLNDANISVTLGASMAPEPFQNRTTAASLASVIDATSATAPEDHNQSTHVWVSGGSLELDFDFGIEYDLQTLHFWNYFAEGFDVDNIDFVFFDASKNVVGSLLGVAPALGGSGGNPIFAEDLTLSFPGKVQFVNAVLTGSNGEVDFNNIGFTANVSCDDPGQANRPEATLLVNGIGVTGNGPFPVTLQSGGQLQLDWSGPANQLLILFWSPRTCARFLDLGCSGFVDLDLAAGAEIVLSNPLFALNNGGTAQQVFTLPDFDVGPLMSLQGLIMQPDGVCPLGFIVTAAFDLIIE